MQIGVAMSADGDHECREGMAMSADKGGQRRVTAVCLCVCVCVYVCVKQS